MITIVDYGMGNLGSIANMFKKLGFKAVISSDVAVIEQATKLILPGVGAFDHGMQLLNDRALVPVLDAKVLEQRTPILGICLGMQLLTQKSEEGKLPGLGWIEAETVRFRFHGDQRHLKVPHMGWNFIQRRRSHPLLDDMHPDPRFYFVHSYYVVSQKEQDILAATDYGCQFTSVVGRDNIVGVQFHPEKSHKFGMKLLKNFVECC